MQYDGMFDTHEVMGEGATISYRPRYRARYTMNHDTATPRSTAMARIVVRTPGHHDWFPKSSIFPIIQVAA